MSLSCLQNWEWEVLRDVPCGTSERVKSARKYWRQPTIFYFFFSKEILEAVEWSKDRWHGLHEGHYRTLFIDWVYFPFGSFSSLEPRIGRECRRLQCFHPHNKRPLCEFVTVHFGGTDHLYLFIQICIRVLFCPSDILRACWEGSGGRFGLIYQIWFLSYIFCDTLANHIWL